MRLRLKTKLVLAISGMVAVVVVGFASIYISQMVRQRLNDTEETGDFIAHQIVDGVRDALELDLSSTKIDSQNPDAVREAAEEALQTDPGLNSLLQSVVGYSRPVYDAAVADGRGHALLHTDPKIMQGNQPLPSREEFNTVLAGGLRKQLAAIYGPAQVYEIRIPISRNGEPFGSVRVGISTIFLQSELRPQLDRALLLSGCAIFL